MTPPRLDLADLVRRSQRLALGSAQGKALLGGAPAGDGVLREVTGFGGNPGRLRMLAFVPEGLPPGAPLVVALHGCTQTAGDYDRGTGWSILAARQGFALLLPEQRQANNPNRCFNWFEPAHTRRDQGEAATIRQMVAHLVARHRLDPRRIFVTGLSAGGAMASVMLATYPEVFAAGAILAGLPYGAGRSMSEAFEAMATGRPRPARDWGSLVRAASPHPGPWPRVSVWQGEADTTVRPANAEEILKQWRDLHGLTGVPLAGEARSPAHRHRLWRGPDGLPLLEHHAVTGMAHGVPIAPRHGDAPLGQAGPYMLDVGLSSTEAIAAFFGLGPEVQPTPQPSAPGWLDRIIAVGRDGGARVEQTRSVPGPVHAPLRQAAKPDREETAADPAAPTPRSASAWLDRMALTRRAETGKPPPDMPDAGGGFDPGRIIRRALKAAGLLER
ncbi:extracellular catalytic domain type 1 short-chain-length polyhydroxyalkanoate depolymerase [Roseicella aerolata]|uniref:PHB depolymerase family esterase n=1 Tax=Roseicella aerolata TaxID=2883479 RepID=A0A9X1L8E5_9PROT|nr:PHB depolymerase family esterase [Roseicella aerolata]MCB4822459.1 PHB depolymerase family esterase [Roseicella aerolata]